MQRLKAMFSALVIGLVLVAAVDHVAYAATGKSLIKGAINKSKKTTTITKTKPGPVLSLKAKPGSAPLKVNRNVLVTKLNADYVDGKSAADLGVRTRGYRFDLTGAGVSSVEGTSQNVPAGTYLASYDAWLYTASGIEGWCWLNGGTGLVGFSSSGTSEGYFPISGTGVMQLGATTDVTLRCEFDANTNVSTYNDVKVTFTRIDAKSGVLPKPALGAKVKSPTQG